VINVAAGKGEVLVSFFEDNVVSFRSDVLQGQYLTLFVVQNQTLQV
jgi:hypothetical protein